jgi:glycosyltransferase involved in cell wall biosynthesis
MRILLTVDPGIPVPPRLYGGIERIVDGLVAELRLRGHAVGLIAHPDSECCVDFLRAWPARASNRLADSCRNTVALLRAVRAFKPDVLHSFSRLGYLLPLLPLRLPKLMSYQRHTGGLRNRIAARLGGKRFVFSACSEFIAGRGRMWGGRWEAIPNFVDTDYYTFQASASPDAPLVFLSRIERIKGAHTAIAIAHRAGRRLIIAGNRVNDGEGTVYWEKEIQPHLGRNGVEYVGPVNDAQKNELLGSAAAMLVPIEWDEPFGIVFAEALACGTPVISCPRGALPEIVRDGEHGFLVRSVHEGVGAVQNVTELSRAKCRRRVEECFSRKVVVSRYEALYCELAGTGL